MEEDDIAEEEAGRITGSNLRNRRNRKFQGCKTCEKVMCWECADEGAGNTAVYLEEAVVKWSVIAVSAIIASSVRQVLRGLCGRYG